MIEARKSYRIDGPTISPETINGLPDYMSKSDQRLNEDRAKALFGLLARTLPPFPDPTDGDKLMTAINTNIIIPNAQRRARLREEGKQLRHPIKDFELQEPLDLTFYGKRPTSETIWWIIQHGFDPRHALDLHTYSFANGAEVHVGNAGGGAKGVLIVGTGDEKSKSLSCAVTRDPTAEVYKEGGDKNAPIFSLRLIKPSGFNAGAASANPARNYGTSPSLGPGE